MNATATVLVPTHRHGPLLAQAVGSAFEQSISNIEIFIVGDGVDPLTREVALELCAQDARVAFFDNEKGPRHGELHRHEALQRASGRIVCYLSDDDLWLPGHVASMLDLLDGADFGHALPIAIQAGGSVAALAGHLEVASSRDRVVALVNFIPLSCGAHTLDTYHRLPFGWRTTPEGIPTDVYMWSQILDQPDRVARSGNRPTVLHFPSPWRENMTLDERLEELKGWRSQIATPDFESSFTAIVIDQITRDRADKEEAHWQSSQRAVELERDVEALQTQLAATHIQLQDVQTKLAAAHGLLQTVQSQLEYRGVELNSAREQLEGCDLKLIDAKDLNDLYESRLQSLQGQLDWMSQSVTWRTRQRLLRFPGIARFTQWAGKARSRRAAD